MNYMLKLIGSNIMMVNVKDTHIILIVFDRISFACRMDANTKVLETMECIYIKNIAGMSTSSQYARFRSFCLCT